MDEAKTGTDWQADELDAIVRDYFAMLALELASTPYVKSKYSALLMQEIGRSHRSVEFKHQNISAVLEELGLPWIRGYKPKRNYQNAIFGAIDRYLTEHPSILEPASAPLSIVQSIHGIFVDPPPPSLKHEIPESLQRLITKFDPVERDRRNRKLGRSGEEFVLEVERKTLVDLGRPDLAQIVRWTADVDGDGAGYDILSFHPNGAKRFLEVKTTNGSARTPFFISRNELKFSSKHPDEWRLYRVHFFVSSPQIFVLPPPLERTVTLTPDTWRASF